ncbi:ATP-binding protein [Desulforegula conservatrix]|uniref:ATP-binding protein n=1 Tax=Desulforegula conservatrix TaxID=153026 RepID=UPI0018DBD279|nr:ATP-binding protein [Desulforegula conservatrix]
MMFKRKGRSISLLLTTSIIFTVAFVSVISISIGYIEASRKAKADLERNLERNISSISEILQVPLWSYDQETIENTGNLYAASEDVVFLTITDSLGQEMFQMEKKRDISVLDSRYIMFGSQVAGTVKMGLSSNKYKEAIRQLLWSGIITMVINLSVLIAITGFLLRMFLKNPLDILSNIVGSYASGKYESRDEHLPYIEFQPVVDVLRVMGSKILLQIGELREAEQKYRSIFENAVEGIFQISPEGRFLSVNPSMARTLGYESPEGLLQSDSKIERHFVSPDEFKKIDNILNESGVISRYDVQGLKTNGEILWFSLSARAVRDSDGRVLYYEGSIFDISDRMEREEAERKQKAADAANQAKTLFIARMSHELRTPLNSVLGMTEMLSETNPTEDQLEYIKLLQSSGVFLESIINDILDFSKIEAQQLILDDSPFDLQQLIEEVAGLIKVRAMEKNLPVTYSIDPGIHRFLAGDPVRLKQILINLGGNAVKFTNEGRVTIEVAKSPDPVNPETYESIVFRVRDTGIGIPESKQGIIFDSFSQADNFIKRQYGGTGLGLAICKRLVELMDGTLSVSSVEGEGSTFLFSLSLKKVDDGSIIEKAIPNATIESLPPMTVLLADDIVPNRKVVHKYLQKSPITIVAVGNGLEALEAYKKGSFDLVLMDVEMPVMNGLESTRRIREWERTNNLSPCPLIIISAHAFGEQRNQCYEAGCDRLLIKPVRKNDLIQAIFQVTQKGTLSQPEETGLLPDDSMKYVQDELKGREILMGKVYIDVMFEDLIKDFFEYFIESLASMETAVAEKDFDTMYRLGHGLKGSARNYEFFDLGNVFLEIEKAAAERNSENALHHIKRARKYLETVDVVFIEKE